MKPRKEQSILRQFSTQIQTNLPAAEEVEVSLFGPGVGECVVLHLGQGKWMVIDSCTEKGSSTPAAIAYLERLGVNPANAVVLIVISHWHDDHIKGMAEMVRRCVNSRVCYSGALLKEEFLALTESFVNPSSMVDRGNTGLDEIGAVIRVLKERVNKDKTYLSDLIPVSADKILLRTTQEGWQVEIRALSPSDVSVHRALVEFRCLLEEDIFEGDINYRKTVPAPSNNRNAVAIWVAVNELNILLGADLEEYGREDMGWAAIVNSHIQPDAPARIFKVPHHGSQTGYLKEVWDELLVPDVVSVLTTYDRGRNPPPTAEDLDRLKTHTPYVCIAPVPKSGKIKRDPTVERTMREVVKARKVRDGRVAHLQLRASAIEDKIHVQVEPPAVCLS